jgi:hypothetical protein
MNMLGRKKMNARKSQRSILAIAIGGLSLFLLTALFFVTRLHRVSDSEHHQRQYLGIGPIAKMSLLLRHPAIPNVQQQGKPEHRIAMILLFVAPKKSSNNPSSIMSYLPLFCASAVGGGNLVDFLIFHTGVLDSWPLLQKECPANVIFINLESGRALAERLANVVETPTMKHDELVSMVDSYIQATPYALVEFKPAFGFIFADYLADYTHWGYADFDMMFGDLTRWITPDELTDYDIVTYTFGDQQRLYIRGQFSFHKKSLDNIWRACAYLTEMDKRFDAIIHEKKRYQVESAEGCYSAAVLDRDDLKVKFAVKAWTDIFKEDTGYSHGVFLNRQSNVIYKVDADQKEKSGKAIHQIPMDWFKATDKVYSDESIPLQKSVGERQRLDYSPNEDANCMYWVMAQYQRKLCLKESVGRNENVLWLDGVLYKEPYENAVLEAPVLTAAFFHFQEWKRAYRFEQLATFKLSSPSNVFALVPEGAVPLLESSDVRVTRNDRQVVTPLGLASLKTWRGEYDQLPSDSYCITTESDDKKHSSCHWATSWRDEAAVHILASAPAWKSANVDTDITLVLTLVAEFSPDDETKEIEDVVAKLKTIIDRWNGKPCVVLLCVSKASDTMMAYARSEMKSYSSVLAAMVTPPTNVVSRKALLNMAIDAVPTRWFLSGIELERGLVLSLDSAALAHQVAFAHTRSGLSGNAFIVPQLAALDVKHHKGARIQDDDTSVVLEDLFFGRRVGTVKAPYELDDKCGEEDDNRERISTIDDHWWNETQTLVVAKYAIDENPDFQRRALVAQQLEQELLEMALTDHIAQGFDESLILLTDNLGPHGAFLTHELARETEPLGGPRCFNALRLQTLAVLGYTIDVLPGAFAVSSAITRKRVGSFSPDRCRSCDLPDKVAQRIAKAEISRATKTAIMWTEMAHKNPKHDTVTRLH